MRPLLTRLPAIALLLVSGLVYAAPPSQTQIDQLLEVSRARETIDNMLPQIQASQQQMVQQMLAGKELTEQQQREFDARMAAVAELLSWDKLQPLYRDLYAQTFDADEVQALIDFYASPAGQGMIQKMPLLMQNVMQAIQAKLIPLLQELQRNLEAQSAAGGHSH